MRPVHTRSSVDGPVVDAYAAASVPTVATA